MYINFHRHTKHSPDGLGNPEEGVLLAKELNQSAVGISDHGTAAGLIEHYRACQKHERKPILGVEAYFQPLFTPEKGAGYHHLSIFAMNNIGYKNICKLTSEAYRDKFYGHPMVDFETLERYNEGLLVFSGCINGYIPQLCVQKNIPELKKATEHFLDIFGDRFYFEVMPNNFEEQIVANRMIIALSKKYNRPVIMTSDSHYTRADYFNTYKVMQKMSYDTGADYSCLYMHSEEEMRLFWQQTMGTCGDAYIRMTEEVAARCDVELEFPELLPKMSGNNETSAKVLARKVKEGLMHYGKWNEKYKERVKYELNIILKKGFEDYFLLCAKFIDYARSEDIPVGTGRGSVGGSLIAYALGIIAIDPVLADISIDRFLNPERVGFPDIDMDFGSKKADGSEGKDRVVEYALREFEGMAAPLGNTIRYKVDNLINDLCKTMGVPTDTRELIKLTLHGMNYELHQFSYQDLMKNTMLREVDVQYDNLLLHFTRMYNQPVAIGKHAAGVVITPIPIDEVIPVIKRDGKLQTAYDKYSVSDKPIFGVKFDILGLGTATMLDIMSKMSGVSIQDIPLDDQETFKAFRESSLIGIFQLERPGARKIVRDIRIDTFNDLVAALAINRPGALQQGALDRYIKGKKGEVTDPILKRICSDSYGAIIYHEHAMKMAMEIAKLDWGITTKIIKRIDQPVLPGDPLEKAFVDGAVQYSGMSQADAKDLYYRMTRYSFNKGHSACYAFMSYLMMWYKVHYPLPFYLASLMMTDDPYKERVLQSEAVGKGIMILLPHVNGKENYSIYEVGNTKTIRIGLRTIDKVGSVATKEIERKGPYESKEEVRKKIEPRKLNAAAFAALEASGAMEFDEKKYIDACTQYCVGIIRKVKTW